MGVSIRHMQGVGGSIDADKLSDEQLRTVPEQMGVKLHNNAILREELLILLNKAAIKCAKNVPGPPKKARDILLTLKLFKRHRNVAKVLTPV